MSEFKGTPGPWCALPNETDKPYVRIRGTRLGSRFKVANVLKMPTREGEPEFDAEETRANARLIAAAPELFGFAQEFIEAWGDGMAGDSSLLHAATAVLAKATGS